MDDRIEQQVTINAPLDRVWELVSQPGWWVPSDVEKPIDRTPGARTVRESKKWGTFIVETVRIEPQTYAAFRWASQFPGEDLAPGKTTLVEFAVTPTPDGVTVAVTETGFASIDASAENRQSGFDDNTKGWAMELSGLKDRAEVTRVR